jgi:hypothetical protein
MSKIPNDHYLCPLIKIKGKLYAECQDFGPLWGPHHHSPGGLETWQFAGLIFLGCALFIAVVILIIALLVRP